MMAVANTQVIPTVNTHEINFEDNPVTVVEKNGRYFPALKPVFEGMGVDWKGQYQKLKDDVVISSVMEIRPTTGRDGKQYEMVCIPLEYLNGVLFKINPSRCPAETRERVVLYQKECYRALHDHFFPRNEETLPAGTTPPQLKEKAAYMRTQLNYRKTIAGMKKQAEKEAELIYKGNGSLEDLDLCPDIRAMTLDALEELNRGDMFTGSESGDLTTTGAQVKTEKPA